MFVRKRCEHDEHFHAQLVWKNDRQCQRPRQMGPDRKIFTNGNKYRCERRDKIFAAKINNNTYITEHYRSVIASVYQRVSDNPLSSWINWTEMVLWSKPFFFKYQFILKIMIQKFRSENFQNCSKLLVLFIQLSKTFTL